MASSDEYASDWTVNVQMTDMQGLAYGLETGEVTPKEAADIIDLMLGMWQSTRHTHKPIKEKLHRLSTAFLKKEIAEAKLLWNQERKESIDKGD